MDTCKRMWSKDEIGNMAGGGLYRHTLRYTDESQMMIFRVIIDCSEANKFTNSSLIKFIQTKGDVIGTAAHYAGLLIRDDGTGVINSYACDLSCGTSAAASKIDIEYNANIITFSMEDDNVRSL